MNPSPYRACLLTAALLALAAPRAMGQPDDAMMASWSEASRMAFQAMTDKYGEPDELTPTMAMWHETGPFAHTVVHARAVPHQFPAPHDDVLEQFVHYRVPPDVFDDLAEYDGSVIVERTKGVMSARCDMEPLNILALNLAHQIVTGEMDVEEAREAYAEQAMAFKNDQPAPLTEQLMFTPEPVGSAGDPDEPANMDDMEEGGM